jgi:hypothetical protein
MKIIVFYVYDIPGLHVDDVKENGVTYYQYGLSDDLLWSDDGSTQGQVLQSTTVKIRKQNCCAVMRACGMRGF